ncbi:MAG TPA: hypothetical protein VGD80_43120 [Kofleriaceae bacterium]
MTETNKDWNDLKRIGDELELKIRLASMDARDRWQALRPRLVALEDSIKRTGARTTKLISEELNSVGNALRKLRDEISRE